IVSKSVHRIPSLFFFSSRRRHTRFSRDWSSDVCSSDLHGRASLSQVARLKEAADAIVDATLRLLRTAQALLPEQARDRSRCPREIGRASCREREEITAGGGALKIKRT